ncbi:MAG: hypothetical protein EOM65_13545 [Synergistales bacterium]|nr:hypothetical protein [Synergistales bacterium]
MALKRYLHGKYVETVIEDPERPPKPLRLTSSDWLRRGALNRAELTNGDLVSVLPHLNLVRENQHKIISDMYSFDELAAWLARGELDSSQELRRECPGCQGKGHVGDEDTEIELCPTCSGHGVVVTPLLVEILQALEWWKNPVPVITEAAIQKKNARLALETEARRKKFAVRGKLGAQLQGLQQQKQLEAGIELSKKIAKEEAKIDAELAAKLAELEGE